MLLETSVPVQDERAGRNQADEPRRPQSESRGAFDPRALTLDYQPVVALQDGAIRGFAAVLRWPGRDAAPLLQSASREVADAVGGWMLLQAAVEARYWPGLRMALEIAPEQVESGALLDQVANALAQSGLAPERLELELADGRHWERGADTLAALRDRGVGLLLGGWGAGSADPSLPLLVRPAAVKLDPALVAELPLDAAAVRRVRDLVARSQDAGIVTIADGVETLAQRDFLRRVGCDHAQGPLYSRPLPPHRLAALFDYGVDTCSARRAAPETFHERVVPH